MGAFDSYAAQVACPLCGDRIWIEGQTKFFDPDYHDERWFQPGVPCAADFGPGDLERLASDGWWRLRDRVGDGTRFTLLADLDGLHRCDCGTPLVFLLHFELAPGTVTLTELEAHDARTELAPLVDFADAEPLWTGDRATFRDAVAQLVARPFAERAAVLRGWLAPWLDGGDHDARADAWTTLVGPMQCEACGDTRERTRSTLLTHPDHPVSFFGPAWTGGVIFLGDRIPFDDRWLADDVDRGWYLRARHPVGDPLAVLGHRSNLGCRCGAGPFSVLARFARRPGAVELVELLLRVVRTRADLADVDFIEGRVRQPPRSTHPPRTREQLLAQLVP